MSDERAIGDITQQKYSALRRMSSNLQISQVLPENEKSLLSSITQFGVIRYFSASKNKEIEKKVHQAFLAILNGENISEQKKVLAELKTQDRVEMSFPIEDKLFLSGLLFLGISCLVGFGVILGLALSLWPVAILLGLASPIFIVPAIWFFKKRYVEFDEQVNHAWDWGYLGDFINALKDEHQALLTKLNSPDFEKLLAQQSSESPSSVPPFVSGNEPTERKKFSLETQTQGPLLKKT